MLTTEHINTIENIACLMEPLPKYSKMRCSELGLFVGVGTSANNTSLIAMKYRNLCGFPLPGSRIMHLFRNSPDDAWQVWKYKPGDWEKLIEPTYRLTAWVYERGGVPPSAENDCKNAIRRFRKTGCLILP